MRLHILIVEDDPLIAMDLDFILEDAGFRVVGIAPSMHAALNIADQKHIDIAIMDINLANGTNGIETAKRLRQDHDVPSLFVSAEITERTRVAALKWEPVGFIGKPYRAEQIIEAIRTAEEHTDRPLVPPPDRGGT